MANPTSYKRGYSFSGFQANNPQKPLPAQHVDSELENIELTTSQLIAGLADIRRSDGKLKNGIVTVSALSPEISTGVQPAVEWTTLTSYQPGATVFHTTAFYRALVAHVSGLFADDLAAERWERYADFRPVIDAAEDSAAAALGAAAAASGSASTAASSAGVAASSAEDAAASAGAAATAASVAEASAVQAANIVGDGTSALRWDVVQALTASQQLQARENAGISPIGSDVATAANAAAAQTAIGISAAGAVLATAANTAAQRGALGQSWVEVGKSVVGSAASGIIIPVTGSYRFYRLRFFIRPNASVADFFTALRFSNDGGATYKSDGSDYITFGDFVGAGGGTPSSTTVGSYMALTGTTDTAFPEIGIEGDLHLVQGSASRRARGRCNSTLFNGSDYFSMRYGLGAVGAYAVDHLSMTASVAGNAFDAGSFWILEGCHA